MFVNLGIPTKITAEHKHSADIAIRDDEERLRGRRPIAHIHIVILVNHGDIILRIKLFCQVTKMAW